MTAGAGLERPAHRRPTRAAAVTAALAVHALLLVLMALGVDHSAAPQPAPAVDLVLGGPLLVRPLPEPIVRAASTPAHPRAAPPVTTGNPAREVAHVTSDTPLTASAAGEPPAGTDTTRAATIGGGTGVDGDALRAIAALFACHGGGGELDPASRTRCESDRLRAARGAPRVDGIPAEKREYYDAVAAAREDERAFRPVGAYFDPRENRGPAIARSRGVDAGFGYRCNIALGHGAAEANRRAGVRWAVPPCAVKPPVGSLTYEARAPKLLTAAEQAMDTRAAARLDPPTPPP